MLGGKLKILREAKGLVQRQVAAELQIDIAYLSKIENSEKPLSRSHIKKLSTLFSIPEKELLTIWLADKLYGLVKDEEHGIDATIMLVEELKARKKGKE